MLNIENTNEKGVDEKASQDSWEDRDKIRAKLKNSGDLLGLEARQRRLVENGPSSSGRLEFPVQTYDIPIQSWLASGQAQLKLVCLPTGSGKTYQAARSALGLASRGVIPVYIAPLRRITADFLSECVKVAKALREPFPTDMYEVRPMGDFEDPATIRELLILDLEKFLRAYDRLLDAHPMPCDRVDADKKRQAAKQEWPTPKQRVMAIRAEMSHLRVYSNFGSSEIHKETWELAKKCATSISRMAFRLGAQAVERAHFHGIVDEVYLSEEMRPLLRITCPLALAQHLPGPIVISAKKATCELWDVPGDQVGRRGCGMKGFKGIFDWGAQSKRRVALFIDEEETCFNQVFDSQSSQLINKDFDLTRVVDAAAYCFGLDMFSRMEASVEGGKRGNLSWAKAVFDIMPALNEDLPRMIDFFALVGSREKRLEYLAKSKAGSLLGDDHRERLYDEIFEAWDWSAGAGMLSDKLKAIEMTQRFCKGSLTKVGVGKFEAWSDYEVYARFIEMVSGLKSLVMGAEGMKRHSTCLSHLFFNDCFQIQGQKEMDSIVLRKLVHDGALMLLTEADAGKFDIFTLGDYLRYLMKVCGFIASRKEADLKPLDFELSDNAPGFLSKCRDTFKKWGMSSASFDLDAMEAVGGHASVQYAYDQEKYVLSFVQGSGQERQYSASAIPLTLSAIRVSRTPEHELCRFLAGEQGARSKVGVSNIAFLMSATADMGSHWGCYFMPFMKQRIEEFGGSCEGLVDAELAFIAKHRALAQSLRRIDAKALGVQTFVEQLGLSAQGCAFVDEAMRRAKEGSEDFKKATESNSYKKQEARNMLGLLWQLTEHPTARSSWAFCLSAKNFALAIKALVDAGLAHRHEKYVDAYVVSPKWFGLAGSEVVVVLYHAKFGKVRSAQERSELAEGGYSGGADDEEPSPTQDEALLEILDERLDRKVFLASAYGSAARGQNFHAVAPAGHHETGKAHPADSGAWLKDLDILGVASAPYYDALFNVKDDDGTKNMGKKLQATMNHLFAIGMLSGTKMEDLPGLMVANRATLFKQEQIRSLMRDIVQFIGRLERILKSLRTQEFYLHEDVLKAIVDFLDLEPEFEKRLSCGNMAAADLALRHEHRGAPYCEPKAWERYLASRIVRTSRFERGSRALYANLASPEVRAAWEAIRSPRMFDKGRAYVEAMSAAPEGLLEPLWKQFSDVIESDWSHAGHAPRMGRLGELIQACPDSSGALGAAPDRPALCDSLHARGAPYEPVKMLAAASVVKNEDFQKALRSLGIDLKLCFADWQPDPLFFFDYVRPYFWELVSQEIIRAQTLISPSALPRTPEGIQAYEAFDIFYKLRLGTLCVDVKSWGEASDGALAPKVALEADEKLARARRAFGGQAMALYLNCLGSKSAGVKTQGGEIQAVSLFIKPRFAGAAAELNKDFIKWLRKAT